MSAVVSDTPPSRSFSELIRDERIRAILAQIIVLALLFAAGAYLISNAVANLEALGKTFGFGFLEEPAGYDINQRLIEYDSTSTHLRATAVGLLNTLLVAVCGVILATVMGFTLGILRLSQNWLVGRLVYMLIEFCRNVPVLVHILLWHGIIIHSLPHPRAAMDVGDSVFLTNRGVFIPRPVFEAGSSFVLYAFIAACIGAWFYARRARKLQDETGHPSPVLAVSLGLVLGVPLLAFVVTGMPVSFDVPALTGFNFQGGIGVTPEFIALWWALSLYTSCFIAEIVRAGIQSVGKGQHEAAAALGLRHSWTLRLVTLPQAMRVIIPPLTSQYLNLTKNSSLAIAIGYMDIVATIGGITLNQTGREMECMIIVLFIYLCFSLSISLFMNWYNKRIALVER